MSFTILTCEQKSPEWFAARAGRVTSSNANDMLATIQKGEAAARRNLRARLALERITGNLVNRTGFLRHDTLMAGASLDGSLDGFTGIVEAKAPEHSAHLEYLRTGRVPTNYLRQVTHQLWMTGAQWCDWFSFQPDFPAKSRVKLVRVNRADVDLAAYELLLVQFLREVDAEADEIDALVA
jgi:predicted phage-related endonuclease